MNRYVVVPFHGTGQVHLVRSGRMVLLATGDGPSTAALAGWCRLFGEQPSQVVADELHKLVTGNPSLAPFALLVLDDEAIDVATYGQLPLTVQRASGVEELPMSPGLRHTRVDDAVAVSLLAAHAQVDPVLELEAGVVGADGFIVRVFATSPARGWSPPSVGGADAALPAPSAGSQPHGDAWSAMLAEARSGPDAGPQPAPSPAAEPPAVAPAPSPAPSPAAPVLGGDDSELPPATPLPTGPIDRHDHDVVEEPSGRPRVRGLMCARGHFNDPRARYCGVCGIAMHQATFVIVEQERPPLGVLVFNDGRQVTLTDPLVVGREPGDDPAVVTGQAQPLALDDAASTLSRIHAELQMVDWDVVIVDRNSTNGTFVWAPGQVGWDRLAPGESRVLLPGTNVSFGSLTATFQSQLRQI